MADIVHVRGTEEDPLGRRQPARADAVAAPGAELLQKHAVRDAEGAGRSAVVVPIGVLPRLPREQPDVTGLGAMEGQIPALGGRRDDEVLPQLPLGRHGTGQQAELAGRQPGLSVKVRAYECCDLPPAVIVDDGRARRALLHFQPRAAFGCEHRSPGHSNCQFMPSRRENCT